MPEPTVEPPIDSWPICASALTFLGMELVCVLPRGHEYDGSDFCRDERGNEWRLTADE